VLGCSIRRWPPFGGIPSRCAGTFITRRPSFGCRGIRCRTVVCPARRRHRSTVGTPSLFTQITLRSMRSTVHASRILNNAVAFFRAPSPGAAQSADSARDRGTAADGCRWWPIKLVVKSAPGPAVKSGIRDERTRARSGRLVNEREWRENRRNLSGLCFELGNTTTTAIWCYSVRKCCVIYEPHGSVYLRHSTLTLTSVAHLQRGAGDVTHRFPVEGDSHAKLPLHFFDTQWCNSWFYKPKSRLTGLCVLNV